MFDRPWANDYADCTAFASGSLASAAQANPLAVFFPWPISWRYMASASIAPQCGTAGVHKDFRPVCGDSCSYSQAYFDYGIRYDYMQPMRSDSRTSRSFVRNLLHRWSCLPRQSNRIAITRPIGPTFSPRVGFSYSPAFSNAPSPRRFRMFLDTQREPFLDTDEQQSPNA